ncbi:MAG: CPBP family intramembrane metalloprotease [Azospirillaceae bacterium]|nr:CPBP family intramembrane metalloprotease [Azospirillaceae bacterium]
MASSVAVEWGPLRRWLGLVFLVAAYFLFDTVEHALYHPLAVAFDLHTITDGAMGLPPYAVRMIVRLILDMAVVAGVCAILGYRLDGPPLLAPKALRFAGIGIVTGLAVMIAAILAILATGSATVAVGRQSAGAAVLNGTGWFVFDFIGAMGEELFGRVAVVLIAERFVGWRGAVLVSGLMFSVLHLGNPGATTIWLVRLFLQGALLAYAVYRTGSFWWSTGYHTGWNWASAPLFGAAGSGYLDRGHLLDFTPAGSDWITGGAVGPEGSVFAFIAVLCAFAALTVTTPRGVAKVRVPRGL